MQQTQRTTQTDEEKQSVQQPKQTTQNLEQSQDKEKMQGIANTLQAATSKTGLTQNNGRINLDQDNAQDGLAQLVLTVIELLREIVERHAIRRVEGGTLTDEQIEDLGIALMDLEEKMDELKEHFDLDDEDLNIDLGPLGNLL